MTWTEIEPGYHTAAEGPVHLLRVGHNGPVLVVFLACGAKYTSKIKCLEAEDLGGYPVAEVTCLGCLGVMEEGPGVDADYEAEVDFATDVEVPW